jgi:hypothetical protein
MKVHAAEIEPYGSPIMVILVESAYTLAGAGDQILERLKPYFPRHPVMLVSVELNGFRAYAPFQTHRLLALIQLENLRLFEVDLNISPVREEDPLPF